MTQPSSKTSIPNGVTEEPTPIEYLRWRHKDRGYLIRVTGVHNITVKHGYRTIVDTVTEDGRTRTWASHLLFKFFEPVGRRWHRKTWHTRI